MLLMLVCDRVFRHGRGFLARAQTEPMASPIVLTPGPWGKLEYVPLALDRPESYFTNDPGSAGTNLWVFRNHTEQQLAGVLGSLDLTSAARAFLLERTNWQFQPHGVCIAPTPEVVVSLSPETRRQLYQLLAANPENVAQAAPFRFRRGGFNDWFADCGLPPGKVALVRRLTYTDQGNLCFADATTFAHLSTPDETKCLLRSLWRVSTFAMKLRVDADTDVDAVVRYWGARGGARAYRPLLESLARVPGGSSVNVTFFLPPFARLRLYTYPSPRDPEILKQDCFWTAMNFFNATPDARFFDPAHTRQALRANYARVTDDTRQFGDLVMLVAPGEKALHLCVYIADNFVFTKNGANPQQPWVLMKLSEMLGEYEIQKPFEVIVYRRHDPPPLSASVHFSSAARSL